MSRSRLFKSQLKQEFQNKGSALIKVTESSLLVGIAATEAALLHTAPPIAIIPVGAGLAIGTLAAGGLFAKVVIDSATRKPIKDSKINQAILDLETIKSHNLISELSSKLIETVKHAKSKGSKKLIKKLSNASDEEKKYDAIIEYITAPDKAGGGYKHNGKKTFCKLLTAIESTKVGTINTQTASI